MVAQRAKGILRYVIICLKNRNAVMPAKAPVKSSSDPFLVSVVYQAERKVSLLNVEVANHCISLKNI